MERESAKHNPRLDDSLKRGADGEGMPDTVGSTSIGNASLTPDEVEFRQELARFLDRTIWPATREDLTRNAASHGAPDRVIEAFGRLPAGSFDGFPHVWEAVSGHREPRKI
jgi:hypothetical protein